MKFKREVLKAIVYDDCINAKKVEDTITGTTRWSILHTMVFEYVGKFYRSTYSEGATEQQDERPYEYDPEEIECPEVEPIEIPVRQWIKVAPVSAEEV